MSPLKHSKNVAARIGRWSARHRKIAFFGWLAFVAVAFAIQIAMPMKTIAPKDRWVGESGKASKILDEGFDLDETGLGEFVLVQSKTKTVEDTEFRATINDVVRVLSGFDEAENIHSPLTPGNEGQVSKDRRSALVNFTPRGTLEDAKVYIGDITDAVAGVQKAHPDLYVGNAGTSTEVELDKVINGGIARAGMIALPLTIGILLLVLGSAVAALVPMFVGLTSVLATFGLVSLVGGVVPMDPLVKEVILLIGLAVGVDYSLFYLRREREERRRGNSTTAALEAAAATSGRAVLISGFTVMIAMAGMFFSGDKTFISFAIGTMLVVAVAMVGSVTVLPAMLSKLGDSVEKGRLPLPRRFRGKNGEGRFWGAVLRPVLRRPLISALAATAVLLALAAPALKLHTANSGLDALPKSMKELQAFHRLDDAFPATARSAAVAIKSDDSRRVDSAIAELKARALASGEMRNPITVERSANRAIYQVDIPLAGGGTDDVSNHALQTLRNEILPVTVGTIPGVEYAVGGPTAGSFDFNQQMKSTAPLVFGFVLAFAFVLLLVAFRSVVVAATAIVLNLLSVAAAYGLLVAIFQWGWGENLLDFNSTGGIASWLPMFLFVILFGLSMDYHVFILSRIREAYDRGLPTEAAVGDGIRETAGVVTGAAVVMVGVFSVFAILPMLDLKEMGIGLAAAILIDATIIRAVLLPAMMKLLGDANWYLPSWLRWLPRLEHGEEATRTAAPAYERAA